MPSIWARQGRRDSFVKRGLVYAPVNPPVIYLCRAGASAWRSARSGDVNHGGWIQVSDFDLLTAGMFRLAVQAISSCRGSSTLSLVSQVGL